VSSQRDIAGSEMVWLMVYYLINEITYSAILFSNLQIVHCRMLTSRISLCFSSHSTS